MEATGAEGSCARGPVSEQGLWLTSLVAAAPRADPTWLRTAFLLAVVGYGTKMGLAPLHTWLPDAHSEAPSPVSALLSGALLNCAFLGILRGYQICVAAGERAFADESLMALGLFSLAILSIFAALISSAATPREFGADVSHYQGATGISQSSWDQM